MSEAKVLMVDDEQEFLEAISERMKTRGFEVTTARDGSEALEKIDAESFDAIVLDMVMPNMDGLETLKHIRDKFPKLQVILLTGQATVPKSVEAIKLGALDFLEKPADIEELSKKIKEAKARMMVLVEKEHEESIKEILMKKGW